METTPTSQDSLDQHRREHQELAAQDQARAALALAGDPPRRGGSLALAMLELSRPLYEAWDRAKARLSPAQRRDPTVLLEAIWEEAHRPPPRKGEDPKRPQDEGPGQGAGC